MIMADCWTDRVHSSLFHCFKLDARHDYERTSDGAMNIEHKGSQW